MADIALKPDSAYWNNKTPSSSEEKKLETASKVTCIECETCSMMTTRRRHSKSVLKSPKGRESHGSWRNQSSGFMIKEIMQTLHSFLTNATLSSSSSRFLSLGNSLTVASGFSSNLSYIVTRKSKHSHKR